jgi:nitroreductase
MDAIETIIGRVSPGQLVDPAPTEAQLEQILRAGSRAPDHGRLRPWRFVVIEGEARLRLGELMAQSLRRRDPVAPAVRLDAERKKALRAPLIVIVAAVVQPSPNVPEIEQIVAAGAAAQNLLLAAHALGFGGFWRTGAVAYDAEVKRALGFAPADAIVGIMYLGTIGMPGKPVAAEPAPVTRRW